MPKEKFSLSEFMDKVGPSSEYNICLSMSRGSILAESKLDGRTFPLAFDDPSHHNMTTEEIIKLANQRFNEFLCGEIPDDSTFGQAELSHMRDLVIPLFKMKYRDRFDVSVAYSDKKLICTERRTGEANTLFEASEHINDARDRSLVCGRIDALEGNCYW